jgi:hypothetical protein
MGACHRRLEERDAASLWGEPYDERDPAEQDDPAHTDVTPEALSRFEIIGGEATIIMLDYYKRLSGILWKNFRAATLDQLLGATLAVGILILQVRYGVVHREDVQGSWWALIWPYMCLVVVLFARHLTTSPYKLDQQRQADLASLQADVDRLQEDLEKSINKDRPEVFALLDFGPNPRFGDGYERCWVSLKNGGPRDALRVEISPLHLDGKSFTFQRKPILKPGEIFVPNFEMNSIAYKNWDDLYCALDRIIERRMSAIKDGRREPSATASTLEFALNVSWSDSSGNQFGSTTEATYEWGIKKCVTRPGPVIRKTTDKGSP